MTRWLACWLMALALVPAAAKEAVPMVEDPVIEQRLLVVSEEMRCLVCQNESLAASRSDLAQDLRRELREQIRQGKSDAQIREFMVERYGDFVLYRPPVKPQTWLLWFGPFLLVVVAVVVLLVYLRRRNRALNPASLTPDEAERVRALLREDAK